MSWQTDFDQHNINSADPNPWLALYLDTSLPMHDKAKRSLLRGHYSWSRRMILPIMRPFARLMIILVKLMRMILPERLSSSKVLHYTIYWGLKYIVSKDANYLILRHFNIGTEILNFIADNAGVTIESTVPLNPVCLEDIKKNIFLVHDLNIYNFIFELNRKIDNEGRGLESRGRINFDAITEGDFNIDPGGRHFTNMIDLQSAIEMYTPMYALLLSDHDFWRASNSLQLDETIAIYVSRILNDPMPLALVRNRHPSVPIITLQAGFRLMLHGLDSEILHGYLRQMKQSQRQSEEA